MPSMPKEPLKDYSNLGARVVMRAGQAKGHAKRHPQGGPHARHPHTGGIFANPPNVTNDQMRQVDNGMRELNGAVLANVVRPGFLGPWKADYAAWRKFADPYLDSFWAKLSELWNADEVAQQVENWRLKLLSWKRDYGRETTPAGEPVPPLVTPDPGTRPQVEKQREDKGESSSVLPWWAWALLGVAAVGVTYGVYRAVKNAKDEAEHKRRALEGVAGRMLEARGVPRDLVSAGMSHASDPSPLQSALSAGDPGKRVYVSGLTIRPEDLDEVLRLAARK